MYIGDEESVLNTQRRFADGKWHTLSVMRHAVGSVSLLVDTELIASAVSRDFVRKCLHRLEVTVLVFGALCCRIQPFAGVKATCLR